MNDFAISLVGWLFLATNSTRVLAYLPQFIGVWRCGNGARSVSLLTWAYFSLSHLTGAMYGNWVAHDAKVTMIFFGNFVATSLLCGVILWKRRERQVPERLRPSGQTMKLARAKRDAAQSKTATGVPVAGSANASDTPQRGFRHAARRHSRSAHVMPTGEQ